MKPELPVTEKPAFSALILAGGASRRMGRDKAWMELDGIPLVRLAVEKVRALGIAKIFISSRADHDCSSLNCPVLHDLEPGFGPMGGIERGLHACTTPQLLVLAVDLPHMSANFLRKLLVHCRPMTGAVPRLNGQLEPLAAVYPKRCHSYAYDAVIKSRPAVRDFVAACLREQAVRTLSVTARDAFSFTNWNSPSDLVSSSKPS